MKQLILSSLLIWFYMIINVACAELRVGFYDATCPRAEAIIQQVVQQRFSNDRSITAALLRMHFHDCFVHGCDASILVDSTRSNSAEKDAGPNLTVRGFDLIDTAKQALANANCSTIVSCADIITLATRDAVALSGGLRYQVPTGRRDGLVSNSNDVNLPGPSLTVSQAFKFFKSRGLTLTDMATLLGAHTLGVSHCGFFQDRLSNFQGTGKPDPTMDPALASRLLNTCGTQSRPLSSDPTAFLDQGTPFVLDNQYYNQTEMRRGILQIDQELVLDRSTSKVVLGFTASNGNEAFRQGFADAMVKLGNVQVLVGSAGEIRRNCRVFNARVKKSTGRSKGF